MRNFQFLGNVDVTTLHNQIITQPQLWKADTYLRDYPQGPFGDTETIFIRFPKASVTELERSQSDPHECSWMNGAIHLPAARTILLWLMVRVEGERIGRVMINRLRPNGRIFPHVDTPIHAEYYSRYHVVVQAGKGNTFRCGEETLFMPAGSVVWFNNKLEHQVHNASAEDRINMVVDIRTFRVEAKSLTPTSLAIQ